MLVCGKESRLGPAEVTHSQADVAEFGERPSELATHPRSKLVARPQGRFLRRLARARDPQNLGAVHAATTMQSTERRPLAPTAPSCRSTRPPCRTARGPAQRRRSRTASSQSSTGRPHPTSTTRRPRSAVRAPPRPYPSRIKIRAPAVRPITSAARLPSCRPSATAQLGLLACRGHVAAHEPLVGSHRRDDGVHGTLVVIVEQLLGPAQPAAHG